MPSRPRSRPGPVRSGEGVGDGPLGRPGVGGLVPALGRSSSGDSGRS
jgi:hypothetical protein